MPNIVITGITGLLGTNLAEDLLNLGYHVKAFVRPYSPFQQLQHRHLQLVTCHLLEDLKTHFEGITICIHIAAETRQHLTRYHDYSKVNVEATKNIYNCCVASGVKKFIYISTCNTIGYGSLDNLGFESCPMKPPFTQSLYAKSKWEAERFLLARTHSIKTVIIHPSFMIGAYDSKPSSGRIILMALKKYFLFYPPGGKNFVAVKDVSKAIIQSITLDKFGEQFLVCHENLSYKEFFLRVNEHTHQKPIMIRIPKWMLMFLGYVGEFLQLLKIPTSINYTNMQILCTNNFYANNKSIEQLHMSYQPIDNAIQDAIRYFQSEGKITKKNF